MAVGKDYEVKVNTRTAGEGRLTATILRNGSKTRNTEECCDVETIANKDGTQSIRFKLKERGEYNFDLRFGGEKITKTTKIVVSVIRKITKGHNDLFYFIIGTFKHIKM